MSPKWLASALGACVMAASALTAGPVAASPSSGYAAFAWGANGKGQIGAGSATDPIDEAVTVQGGANSASTWQEVTAGYTTACGIAPGGLAYCWGDNRYGSLGNGTTSTSGDDSVPVAVAAGLTWKTLSAGGYYASSRFRNHVCGISTVGNAFCWGFNGNGQLGNGTTSDDSVPHAVSGGLTWSQVTAGGQHTCGITSGGAGYCWGWNGYGQLGDGTHTDSSLPVPVSGSRQWKALSAGLNWTCGITLQGEAYCWGMNGDGELGNGTNTDDSVPSPVIPSQNASGGWKYVDAGYQSTCAIGLDDVAYCWGHNFYGQLGNMTTDDTSFPVRVAIPAGEPVISVGVGTDTEFACGMTSTNVYCWGDNSGGALGNLAGVSPQLVPLVTTPTWQNGSVEPKALSVGGSFSMLLVGAPEPAPSPSPSPSPSTPIQASAPRAVVASPADASASVAWVAPASSGSYPVTTYQVVSTPGSRMCLTSGLSCTVEGLTNGTPYTFTVKALNGAGWSVASEPSNAVTPSSKVGPSITITGSRTKRLAMVSGVTTGFGTGGMLTSWVRLSSSGAFEKGTTSVLISADGTFTWERRLARVKGLAVYFTGGEVRSNTVVIR